MKKWTRYLVYVVLAVCGSAPQISHAESKSAVASEPIYIEAARFDYDDDAKIVTASGDVQVTQGERVVLSDDLTYYLDDNIVLASGQVKIVEPDGNVYFAEKIELKDDLKKGVVIDFRARLSDGSLLAANQAVKVDENVVKLKKAVYSPCKLCENEPEKAPFWQIKANEVIHDTAQQKMFYRDAYFEFYGVPIAYTPYFSHPTPDADRKSGFLTPTYRGSGTLGAAIETPYYYAFSDRMDATITPILTSGEGVILYNEFRHITENGYYQFRGSITNPEKRDDFSNVIDGENEVRGHIEGFGNFTIDDEWGWGFSGKRATDDTYLGRYGFGYADTLTSTAFVEKIKGREHIIARGLTFQGLKADDDPDVTPLVIPLIGYNYESSPLYLGSRWYVEGNMMGLTRRLGADSNRVSSTVGWKLPLKSEGGHFYEVRTSLRGDAYSINDYSYYDNAALVEADDQYGRLVPEAEMAWRYPLINRLAGGAYVTLEPRVSVLFSPDESGIDKVPNEDSQVVEFSDVNLFAPNRYPGYDVIETGARVNYGLGGTLYLSENGYFDYLFGQNYHADDNSTISAQIGDEGDSMSDYVGRLEAKLDIFNVLYRFRLKNDGLAARRNEIDTSVNLNPVTFGVNYYSFDDDFYLGDRKQAGLGATWAINDRWSVNASGQRDLSEADGGMIYTGAGLTYQNECIAVITGINREFTRDRDIEPSTSFLMKVALKNLD